MALFTAIRNSLRQHQTYNVICFITPKLKLIFKIPKQIAEIFKNIMFYCENL